MNHIVSIFTDRKIVLQRLLDTVRNGFCQYIFGSIPINKLEQTLASFEHDYHAFDNKNERAKRARLGLGNVHAVLWYDKREPHHVKYWLLSKPQDGGRHPIHSNQLQNALNPGQRINIDDFELVRMPKDGTSEFKFSWRMTDSKYQAWREYVIKTVRSKSHHQMSNMLRQLWSSPGFNGARKQVGHLANLYRGEVKRASIKGAPTPPSRLFYLRRLPHLGLSPKQLLAQLKIQG